MRRLIVPEDVGRAVASLATAHGGFITGQTVRVDGGASLMDSSFPLEIQWPATAS